MKPSTRVMIQHKGRDYAATVTSEHGPIVRVSFFDGKKFHCIPMQVSDCREIEISDDEE